MRSSFIIDFQDRKGHQRAFYDFIYEVRLLAGSLGKEAKVSFQNNLKTDVLAIMVVVGHKTLGGHGDTFRKAVAAATRDVIKFKVRHDGLQTASVPASRAKSGKGRRRKSPAR